jgi:predicted ATPase
VTHRLVEREPEIAAIARALDGLAAGEGSALAILGPAGAGKTSLIAYASETAPATVLRATASELERDFPFGVVRQLLEQTVRQSPDQTQSDVLAGAARLAAPALGLDADPAAIRPSFGLLHGLYWVIANLSADQSLVLATASDSGRRSLNVSAPDATAATTAASQLGSRRPSAYAPSDG